MWFTEEQLEIHGVIERHANLAYDLELLLGQLHVIDVVGAEGRADGETGQGIAVARAEPQPGAAGEVVDVAAEEFAVASACLSVASSTSAFTRELTCCCTCPTL